MTQTNIRQLNRGDARSSAGSSLSHLYNRPISHTKINKITSNSSYSDDSCSINLVDKEINDEFENYNPNKKEITDVSKSWTGPLPKLN